MTSEPSGAKRRFRLSAPARRRTVVFVLVGACVAVLGAAMTGNAPLPSALDFLQVGHWVYNDASSSAVHVDGSTGQVDARANVPAAAGSQVTQGDHSGYVVERSRITEFDKSTLSVGSSTAPPSTEEPFVVESVGGPYLVYRTAGQIVRLGDPAATIPAGGPLSAPVVTSDGTLWLHRIDNGAVCELPRGATLLACPGRLPQGHGGSVAMVDDRPVVVDTTADTMSLVGKDGLGDGAGLGTDLPDTAQVANDAVDGRLAVADPERGKLELIDTGSLVTNTQPAAPVSVDLPANGRFSGPVAAAHTIVLVDQVHNELLSYHSDGSLNDRKPVSGPGGTVQPVVGQDGRIYVDNADGSHVLVVDGQGGAATDVDVDQQPPGDQSGGAPQTPPSAPPSLQAGPIVVAQQPPPDATPPGAPRNVKATAGDGSATVSWSAATSNGAKISAYAVSWPGGSTTVSGSRGSVTISGLENGRSYTFTVVAQNSAGQSAGASSKAVVPGHAADAPKVTATAGSSGAVSVSWSAPDLHGATLDHYEVTATGQGTRQVSATSTSFTGLSGTISFTVRAITHYGSGAMLTGASGSAKATVASGPPTVSILSVRGSQSNQTIYVTVDANGNGAPATCQTTFLNTTQSPVACSGTTEIPIPNAYWLGQVTISVTIKTSLGTASDSWTGTP
ncbi:fibronectin type III domain-containing protein [Amycolatopsis sp.]|uniref:fibronectin type III domain-containing protein n=1 Tax=Amycolatopsis sp. TaxID=37632 RepID=UPI002C2110ED|nr:fibronectin type III domain-containing protein [Amycolatopsis sp.]HVV09013.1 fibronectin type III domain-containing protein [Amycolatopsis sp.]